MTQGSAELETSRLVVLHASGEGKPLFVFSGIYQGPELFHEMAGRLGERPVYGFQHIGARNECPPVREVGLVAQLYAAELRRLQPHGPYHVFGHAFGGVIAFEIARELTMQGEKIGLVMMADCPAPGYPKPAPYWRRARTHVQHLLAGGFAQQNRLDYVRERLANVQKRFSRATGFVPAAVPVSIVPRHVQRVHAALYEAMLYYAPLPQSVDVLFLTAETPPEWPTVVFDDPLLGWGPYLRGRISQCSVPGTHLSIFAPDNVSVLTDRVREALGNLERAEAARSHLSAKAL
ncbi:MAG: thioesterase domain-containing protein [Polyangiales bacterium]